MLFTTTGNVVIFDKLFQCEYPFQHTSPEMISQSGPTMHTTVTEDYLELTASLVHFAQDGADLANVTVSFRDLTGARRDSVQRVI